MSDKAKHIDIDGGEGQVWKRLNKALADACPMPNNLQQVLLELGGGIGDHFGPFGGNMPEGIDSVIQKYNAAWEIDKLVRATLKHVPNNGYLLAFALERGIEQHLPATNSELDLYSGGDSLERMLDEERGFTNPIHLIRRMETIVNAVCQINVADKLNGTGFLISNNVVITNYHVVEKVIEKAAGYTPDRIKLRFDYQTPADGGDPRPGNEHFPVDGDGWLIDYSKYDPQDAAIRPREKTLGLTRATDHLDFALIRVNGSPGEDLIGEPASPRGFLPIPKSGPDYTKVFQTKSGVFIFQHPLGTEADDPKVLPLRVDWEKPADVAMDTTQTRVVYNVNTRKGSSGSPCLNPLLELIALHHSGGKDWPAPSDYLYNQGIPIDKIRELIKSHAKWDQI